MAWLRALHRWIGLLLGVIVFAVAASGGLLLLRDPYYRAVYPSFTAAITAAEIDARAAVLTTIEERWDTEGIQLVKFPRPGLNVYQVWLLDGTEAFVSPHDGAVIDQWHWSDRLPAFLFELHAHLLADPAGTVANGIAALVMVFMGLTGIVLWWPARRSAYRLRGALPRGVKRGDILRSHAAAGIIAAAPILVFAGSGAIVVFYESVETVMTGLFDVRAPEQPDARVVARDEPRRSWSAILAELDSTFPEGDTVFYYPGTTSNARLMFRKRLPGEWHPNGRSYVIVDPYSGQVVQAIDARAQGAGTRFMHAVYPVHAAKVGGPAMILLAAMAAGALTWLAVGGTWSYLAGRVARRRRLVS